MELTKGCFVTLEGIDGVGKTDLSHLLNTRLENLDLKCLLTKTPGEFKLTGLIGSSLGPLVRNVLFTKTGANICYQSKSLLLLADHLQMVEEVVKPKLKENYIIISDRFMDSQFATWGRPSTDPINETFSKFYTCIPDLTILLIGDPQECYYRSTHRSQYDNDKQANKEWSSPIGLQSIQNRYLNLLSDRKDRHVLIISTENRTMDEVEEIVFNRLIEWLQANQYLQKDFVKT